MTMMYSLFVIFSCVAFSVIASTQETDTLQQGEFLNSSSQLVSANKLFVLGFHSPDPQNSSNIYLAIWYKNNTRYNQNAHNNSYTYYSSQLPVWIGNRNTPIRNNSAILSLDSFGNLFIKTNTSFDSFNLYSSGRRDSINTTATLLGTGNFVVRETDSNGSVGRLLWQSFDYPTDTLLPGMKLGVNHKTGQNWTLTSRFSNIKPRNGAFTLEWDPEILRLVVRHRGVIYWTSGRLKNGEFEFWNAGIYFLYELVSEKNEDEEYFYYKLANTSSTKSLNAISGWFLDFEGSVYDPNNGRAITILDSCYGTVDEWNEGCETWEQPTCRNSHQKFDLRTGDWLDSGLLGSPQRYSNFSISDCREECWRDCNCVGYSYSDYGVPNCRTWSGQYNEFEQDLGGDSERHYVLTSETNPAEAPMKSSTKKSKKWIPIVTAAIVLSLATLLFALLCYLKRKRRQRKEKELLELMTVDGYTETVLLEKDGKKGQDVTFFSYSSIVSATNSFSAENKLGEGGFGPVYKGNLMDGREIAVKRLSRTSGQGLIEFKNELILIAKLQHTNLVRVLGCCMHGDEKMLIYEYMPNKSLDFFLFDQKNRSILDWSKRVNIIEGIAQGLLYLHKYSRMRVIHRDLKASNVLLDKNMNPKISDFGMARIFKPNETEAMTNRVVGTYGYMSPEYAMEGTFSVKSDVFSFGVLVLEIVSGRRNNSFYHLDRPLNLVGYAWELWKEGDALELKDPTLGHSFHEHQLLRIVHIGLLCVQESATDRPNMSDVIVMLSNESLDLPYPKQPAFFTGRTVREIPEVEEGNYSLNYASISDMQPR